MPDSLPTAARGIARRVRRSSAVAVVRLVGAQQQIDPGRGAVALTFDDGPDPEHTPAILDELARLGAVATFFLVGANAQTHPRIVRRILAEGHAVGSHSSSHPEPWCLRPDALLRDYARGRTQVEHAAQRSVHLFRPPKGYVDAAGAAVMLAARLRPWLWTLDPRDWQPDVSSADIVAGLAPMRGGDVVLLHDRIEGPLAPSALDRSATREALPEIVALARARGLELATLG